MITLHQTEQGSEEWLALREGLYTGSNADKLLKYGKIDYAINHTNNFKGNFWTERGHLLEAEAIDLYQKIKEVNVLRVAFVTNDKYPDCGYSPDGVLGDVLIEVKCFNKKLHMELIKNNIPFKVLAQVYFGMFVCELPIAHLIAYNPKIKEVKDRFKIIEIKNKKTINTNFKRIFKED